MNSPVVYDIDSGAKSTVKMNVVSNTRFEILATEDGVEQPKDMDIGDETHIPMQEQSQYMVPKTHMS